MTVVAILVVALSAWLIDSAITGRPPLTTIKDVLQGQPIPPKGSNVMMTGYQSSTSGASNATGSGITAPATSSQVNSWIAQAFAALENAGYPSSELNQADVQTIIKYESGGNPNAINLSDSNAAAGHPSIGLMQTIPGTFAAHALPGHTDIHNPVDNIIAGIRYAIGRYGSLDNVPGIVSLRNGGKYVGY